MSINEKMYREIYLLRQKLKDEGRKIQGRTPLICTDEALYQIAEMCPKKISDFESIPGIGRAFIDNYAEDFLGIICKYTETEAEKIVNMNSITIDILKELEKKLVSINRRNRLLYMPKAANRYAVDLFGTIDNPLDIIFGNKDAVTVCKISEIPDISDMDKNKSETIRYRQFVQLLREANKDLREKGQNTLYIGYPFVIGRMVGEDFDVRAPLALFPIVAERTATEIKLSLDDSRDILYNTTLILANFKFNSINRPLPSETIEDVSNQSFIDDVLSFYKDNDITIIKNDNELCKFSEYKADEFPKFNSGELHVENCMVLGKYPVCDNAIQKDFDEILKNKEVNTLLNDLLLEINDIDYESDGYSGKNEIKIDDKPLAISESELVYINELNSSQESVLVAVDKVDELVIQGPPGTGKSQTITSLISNFVNKNKTVLMVSEKKTALDVVYSRLGNLSKYALLIDDVGNKELFYQQLHKMFSLGKFNQDELININTYSEEIDLMINKLEKIASELYAPNEFGIEPYKIYQLNKKIDLSNELERQKMAVISSKITPELMVIKFDVLEKIHSLFNNENSTLKLEQYINIDKKYPWISKLNSNMTEYEIIMLEEKLIHLKELIETWQEKNIIARIFSKNIVNNEINRILEKYFVIKNKELKSIIFNKLNEVIQGIKNYTIYQENKTLYDRLSNEEKSYLKVILEIKNVCSDSMTIANNELFNYLLYTHISKFEAENRILFQDIDNFDSIIRSLSDAITKKQKLTKQRLETILAGDMYNITTSKRNGEIFRAIESKRKWSVNKFIQKFNFELFKSVKIWLLTPEVVSEIIPLQTGIFDLVVFDEASQMFVEKGLPSILRAKKVVIAGDHKQLRPTNLGSGRIEIDEENLSEDEEVSAALEEESLLDLARFKYRDILLNFHYRSKYEELISFSNYAFYNGRLYVSPNAEESEKPPIEVHKIENGMWTHRANIEEAKYIVEMLKEFFEKRKSDDTIGIITFNSTQRDLIEDLIDEECAKSLDFATKIRTEIARRKDGEDIGLFVKNIESVQGDERDVIIFSIGYAKNESGRLVRNFGWLNQKGGENRLNVAISRARKKIHIVTSINPSELQVEDTKNDGPRILKKYLEYTFAVSNNDKEAAKQILLSFGDVCNPRQANSFDSDFENQVYDALVEKGYQVDTQVGIGGYSIDLAIKKNNNYVLGIECDGKLYHSFKSARERDYHRQKYLESRGWRIHRIWSTNWWKNPKQEILKICNLVDSLS